MEKINSFLGFTDGKTPMIKARIEKTLSKLTRYESKVYDNKTFMLHLLINEGGTPEKAENVIYHSTRTESGYTKPKTEYRMWHKDGFYITVTKTEYDFYNYCMEKGFTTAEAVEAYIAEEAKTEEERREAEEKEVLEKIRREEEEKAEFEKIIKDGIASVTDEEMELAKNIFLDINKTYNVKYCEELIALIKNFDFPAYGERVISILHNDNKASIKVFECMTGLELPKSYKKRIEYLRGVSVSDFKGARIYKPEAAKENEEIFYISMSHGDWNGVRAEPVSKYGLDMFIFEDKRGWTLSEAKSGLNILKGENKETVLRKFDEMIEERTETEFKNFVDKKTKEVWKENGINPKYV